MNRNEEKSLHDLLKGAYANNVPQTLSSNWRKLVMGDINRQTISHDYGSDWDRLAPRFTFAATVLSILLLVTASWMFSVLTGELDSLYLNQMINVVPTSLTSL